MGLSCISRLAPALSLVKWVLLFTLLPGVNNALAAIDAYPFPNGEMQARYQVLIDELRCPQCLNTNLAGSDAMIAKDLRREVHRLVLEGKSDDQIRDFMQQRYGDFILYKPRLKPGTILLWFGPLLLLLVAILVLGFVVRRRHSSPSTLTELDEQRLKQLVDR